MLATPEAAEKPAGSWFVLVSKQCKTATSSGEMLSNIAPLKLEGNVAQRLRYEIQTASKMLKILVSPASCLRTVSFLSARSGRQKLARCRFQKMSEKGHPIQVIQNLLLVFTDTLNKPDKPHVPLIRTFQHFLPINVF